MSDLGSAGQGRACRRAKGDRESPRQHRHGRRAGGGAEARLRSAQRQRGPAQGLCSVAPTAYAPADRSRGREGILDGLYTNDHIARGVSLTFDIVRV